MKKPLLLVLLSVVLLAGAYAVSVYVRIWNSGTEYRDIARGQQLWLAEEYARGAKINALEKMDTYGGATPQETWKLFVAALEAGDTDLAAKYFVIEKQDEMRVFLKKEKEGDTLKYILADFKTIEKEKMFESKKDFDFITKPDIQGYTFNYSLHYSTTSNLWKIYEL